MSCWSDALTTYDPLAKVKEAVPEFANASNVTATTVRSPDLGVRAALAISICPLPPVSTAVMSNAELLAFVDTNFK
jgi:hypothetical protein